MHTMIINNIFFTVVLAMETLTIARTVFLLQGSKDRIKGHSGVEAVIITVDIKASSFQRGEQNINGEELSDSPPPSSLSGRDTGS